MAKCESTAIDLLIFLKPFLDDFGWFCEISGLPNPAAYWKVHNLSKKVQNLKCPPPFGDLIKKYPCSVVDRINPVLQITNSTLPPPLFKESGRSFGEIALIRDSSIRNASIIADEITDLLVVHRDLYNQTLKVGAALPILHTLLVT